jgi:hypothetical protein
MVAAAEDAMWVSIAIKYDMICINKKGDRRPI